MTRKHPMRMCGSHTLMTKKCVFILIQNEVSSQILFQSQREKFIFVKWIGKSCKLMRKAKVRLVNVIQETASNASKILP